MVHHRDDRSIWYEEGNTDFHSVYFSRADTLLGHSIFSDYIELPPAGRTTSSFFFVGIALYGEKVWPDWV